MVSRLHPGSSEGARRASSSSRPSAPMTASVLRVAAAATCRHRSSGSSTHPVSRRLEAAALRLLAPGALAQRGGEAPLLLLPPAAAALVALHAPHLLQHPDEVRVTTFHTPTDELTASFHGPRHDAEELAALLASEAVGIGDQTESCGAVGPDPTEPGGTEVVVDGHAHP